MNSTTAILYARVSTALQEERGTSLPDQLARCRADAARIGATVVAELSEDVSGGLPLAQRPALSEALRRIEAGEARYLIVASVDRLARNLEEQQAVLRRLENARAAIRFADMALPAGADGQLLLAVLGGISEYERRQIGLRTQRGKLARARSGRQVSCRNAPLGYAIVQRNDVIAGRYPADLEGRYVVLDEPAALVRDLYARYAAGQTLGELAGDLNRRGVPTPSGKGEGWHRVTIARMLANPAYKGEATYTVGGRRRGGESVIIPCPPLVEPALWERCQERRRTNAALSGKRERRHLLAGLVRCPECGHVCTSVRLTNGLYWRCRRRYNATPGLSLCKNGLAQRDATIREALRHLLGGVFASPEAARALIASAARPALPDHHEAARRRQTELIEQRARVEQGHLAALRAGADGSAYLSEIERLSRLIATQEQLLAERPKSGGGTRALAERLAGLGTLPAQVLDDPDLTDAEKGRFVAALVDAIIERDGEVEFQIWEGVRVAPTGQKVGTTVASVFTRATDGRIRVELPEARAAGGSV